MWGGGGAASERTVRDGAKRIWRTTTERAKLFSNPCVAPIPDGAIRQWRTSVVIIEGLGEITNTDERHQRLALAKKVWA